jgi:beta-glucosidase
METWLPGDAFGPAIAGMLFGDREPGGRLPVTFPADETQGPATQRREFPGLTDPATGRLSEAYFDEGVFVGYRYYPFHQQKPLCPFGHGLGYGQVQYDQAEMRGSTLRVRLTNTGARPTSTVPQVYVGFPTAAREPPRQLKAFAKISLAPGESRTVDLPFPENAIRYWDSNAETWRVPDELQVMLGRSSEDIVWQGSIGASTR